MVFSADRPPSALTEIDARLRSHLSAGPGLRHRAGRPHAAAGHPGAQAATCSAVSRASARRPAARGRCEFLADRFTDSVRELEGALNTLIVRAGAGARRPDAGRGPGLLRPHLRGGEKRITVDDIQKATSEHFGLKQADLISERRTRSVARPRQAAMWLAKQLTTRSLPDIGRRFGGRDHTTVLHAVRRIETLRGQRPPAGPRSGDPDPQAARLSRAQLRRTGTAAGRRRCAAKKASIRDQPSVASAAL